MLCSQFRAFPQPLLWASVLQSLCKTCAFSSFGWAPRDGMGQSQVSVCLTRTAKLPSNVSVLYHIPPAKCDSNSPQPHEHVAQSSGFRNPNCSGWVVVCHCDFNLPTGLLWCCKETEVQNGTVHSLYSLVTLDKLLNISVPWFTHLKNKDEENSTAYFNRVVIKISGCSECKMLCRLRKY